MLEYSLGFRKIRRLIWLVLTIFVLSGYSLQNAAGSVYYPLSLQPYTTVTTPPVILQAGTKGTSTIYTNNTSALVNVAAPVSTYDFVDNNTSDVDSSADKGTHSNFTAQQYGPDSIYDTLTEENIGAEETNPKYAVTASTSEITGAPDGSYATVYKGGTCEVIDYEGGTGTIQQVYFNITYYGTVSGTLAWAYQLDGGGWNNIEDLPEGGSSEGPLTRAYNATSLRVSWTWDNLNTTDIQFQNNDDKGPEDAYVNAIYVTVVTSSPNFELDLEVQWTNANYTRTNEELCIKTGTTDAEDLKVYVWNSTGSSWHLVFSDLTASSWNNVSVTSYLVEPNFTVRFLGGTETGDTNQESWDIDATLLHVWTDQSYDYVLEVTNTVADAWNIRLKKYDQTYIERLKNCTIYFHNGGGNSRQIYILNGAYDQQAGDWYNLAASSSDYIAITLSATSTGTSYVYVYLEILIPGKSTYSQYVITFEIT